MRQLACILAATCCASLFSQSALAEIAGSERTERHTLALEDVVKVGSYQDLDLSPDGSWLAYSYLAGSEPRLHARLTELATGRVIELGQSRSGTMFGGVPWSSDSRRFVYTSDENGIPRLWVWDRASGRSHAIRNAAPSANSTFQSFWLPDNQRFVLSLPREIEPSPPAEGDDFATQFLQQNRPPFLKVAAGEASVYVYRAPETPTANGGARIADSKQRCRMPRSDLVFIDLRGDTVTRIAEPLQLGPFYQPSPDGRLVAYSVVQNRDLERHEDRYDLHVFDMKSRRDRIVAAGLYVHGFRGKAYSWSPDSRHLAFAALRFDQADDGDWFKASPADLAVVSIAGGGEKRLIGKGIPLFDGWERIVWSGDSRKLYAVSLERRLWEVSVGSRVARMFDSPPHRAGRLVIPDENDGLRSGDTKLWMTGENVAGTGAALYELDTTNDVATKLIDGLPYAGAIDVSRTANTVVYTSAHPQRPEGLALWSPGNAPRAAGNLNTFADEGILGDARKIEWRSTAGEPLAGALLLPPGYESTQRLPLVVWVYGGKRGSRSLDTFGFGNSPVSNMQVLATRGYAVLFPDAPQRLGHPLEDLAATVLPGVDATIAQGFADPERLAVMGHSYGSYSTLVLITQTPRFKAAVISAVLWPDLLAGYMHMRVNGLTSQRWFETGQGLMGVSPWPDSEVYRVNSPVYRFDKIETPLLMAQGELDPATGLAGGNAVFAALRRLGKPVEYRVYEGESHTLTRPANVIDFWNRRLSFLAEHLDTALDVEGRVIMVNGRAKSRSAEAAKH